MLVLYTSDIHVDAGHLDRLFSLAVRVKADAILIGGDLVPVRGRTLAESIDPQRRWVRTVLLPRLSDFRRRFPGIPLYFDFGNDDFLAARSLLMERNGKDFTLIHQQVIPIGERLAVVGYMCVPPTPFRIKDWEKVDCSDRSGIVESTRRVGSRTDTGVETSYKVKFSHGTIQDDLDRLNELLESVSWRDWRFIFVSHSPPLDTALDRILDGTNVGSLALRRFIERWGISGRLCAALHGHIHEGPKMSGRVCDRISGVPCFNVGQETNRLHSLLFDPDDVPNSARLVYAGDDGGTDIRRIDCEWGTP